MAVSTLIDPFSPLVSGAGGAVNSQRPWDLALSSIGFDVLVCFRPQGRVVRGALTGSFQFGK
jgi:hypothetical protein